MHPTGVVESRHRTRLSSLRYRKLMAKALAAAFGCAPSWTAPALVECAKAALVPDRPTSWLERVAKAVLVEFPGERPPDGRALERFLIADKALHEACAFDVPRVRRWMVPKPEMNATRWPVPVIPTAGDLAAFLEIPIGQLDWFADPRGLERIVGGEALRHYRYRWLPKKSGGVRLLEAPKARTKAIQRQILDRILVHVTPHEAVHGFRRGRSVKTHVEPHVGKAMVLRVDLADFFTSVSAARVVALFEALGYPRAVANLLAALCTNRAPNALLATTMASNGPAAQRPDFRARPLARNRHLPQGAPTSPTLANLCAFRLDVRLSALARTMNVTYTRYADDLVFSGDESLARRIGYFETMVAAIAISEGFAVNHRKTRRMRRGGRQRVTGVVVNERATVSRAECERLEAILYNCSTRGPESQNRERRADFRAYLRGRVAWVASIDPGRGQWLKELFGRIVWAD